MSAAACVDQFDNPRLTRLVHFEILGSLRIMPVHVNVSHGFNTSNKLREQAAWGRYPFECSCGVGRSRANNGRSCMTFPRHSQPFGL